MSKVNNEVERRLKEIEKIVREIEDICECLHEDIESATECSDMYMIERRFEKIEDKSVVGYTFSRRTEDEFSEE